MRRELVGLLSTDRFDAQTVERRLAAVLDAREASFDAASALCEVIEDLHAQAPERVPRAAELYVAEIYWHALLQRESGRPFAELLPLAPYSGYSFPVKRTTLSEAEQSDFLWLMRLLARSLPEASLSDRAARLVAFAQDLVRALGGDSDARARLPLGLGSLDPGDGPSVWSCPPIDERIYGLIAPRFRDDAAELRALVEHLRVANSTGLASTGARVIARRLGMNDISPGVTQPWSKSADAGTVTHVAARPLLELAHRLDRELACAVVQAMVSSGWLAKDRAMWMCDALAWDQDLEVRSTQKLVRARRLGRLLVVWSGRFGAGGRLTAKVEKTLDGARRSLEKALASAESKLSSPRGAPAPLASLGDLEARFCALPDRAGLSELLRATGGRLPPSAGAREVWVRAVHDPELVRMLLGAGAVSDPTHADALRACSWYGFWGDESAKLLLTAGATVTFASIREAVDHGNTRFLTLLLEHGATIAADEHAPLCELAAERRHYAMMELLAKLQRG